MDLSKHTYFFNLNPAILITSHYLSTLTVYYSTEYLFSVRLLTNRVRLSTWAVAARRREARVVTTVLVWWRAPALPGLCSVW